MFVHKRNSLSEKGLLAGNLAANTAHSMVWPVTTLHITVSLGQSLTASGVVLLGAALMNILGSFVAGKLFDRWRPYPSLLVAVLIALTSVAALIHWNSWPIFALLIWTASFGIGAIQTLLNAYATTVQGKNTRVIFNNMYIVLNVGVVLGTLAVGYLFDYGFFWLMDLATLLYLLLLVLVLTLFNVPTQPAAAATSAVDNGSAETEELAVTGPDQVVGGRPLTAPEAASLRATKEGRPVFRITTLIFWIACFLFVTYLSYMLWETVMAPHMRSLGIPTRHYADLWVMNGLTIIIFQKMISNWANKHPYRLSVITGGLIFASSFFLMLFVNQFWQIVIVFELLTLGEMLASPQVPAWISQITPKEVSGQAQGFVGMMISLGRMVGPLYGGLLLDRGLFNLLFLSVFAFMLVVNLGLFWMTRTKPARSL
ncbi:MFS transporter [Leuconostocaceae bacterium ESL0958]|nr:MFS transporter [Leuconostocaceae bacterium ESL0958]